MAGNRTARLELRVTTDEADELRRVARLWRCSVSDVVRQSVMLAVKHHYDPALVVAKPPPPPPRKKRRKR